MLVAIIKLQSFLEKTLLIEVLNNLKCKQVAFCQSLANLALDYQFLPEVGIGILIHNKLTLCKFNILCNPRVSKPKYGGVYSSELWLTCQVGSRFLQR